MKRKIGILGIYLLLILCFVGCGDKEDPELALANIEVPQYTMYKFKDLNRHDRYMVEILFEGENVSQEQLTEIVKLYLRKEMEVGYAIHGFYINFKKSANGDYVTRYEYGPDGSAAWDSNTENNTKKISLKLPLKLEVIEKKVSNAPSYTEFKKAFEFNLMLRKKNIKIENIEDKKYRKYISEYLKNENIDMSVDEFINFYKWVDEYNNLSK